MPDKKKRKKIKPNLEKFPTDSFLYLNNRARKKYSFDNNFFDLSGDLFIPDFKTVQLITRQMNQKRDLNSFPQKKVKAAQLNAFALINQIYYHIVELYCKQNAPELMNQLEISLQKSPGKQKLNTVIKKYENRFRPFPNLNKHPIPETIKEIFLINMANLNPAISAFKDLFDDTGLKEQSEYSNMVKKIKTRFLSAPYFGPDKQDLFSMLNTPHKVSPQSLSGQLKYIYQKWKPLIKEYHLRILNAIDLLQEEELKMAGPGKIPEYKFANLDWTLDKENYSQDSRWMSCLVLMAKNIHVWLNQLSAKYGYSVLKLDQIPDQELDALAEQGFTGLWLIGLWERSPASQQIKKNCGNPEAMASAYSIFEYHIAADLGGEKALQNLRMRALDRHIRLSCDMVPNHMGIDSDWVIKKPDYFIYLEHSPYPAYSFNGPDLSSDPGVGILIEDHYYDQSDAAVVFMRIDKNSGETRYIYHGNDGTSMPWNDTAQLNYLNPEVREAIIQTILAIARQFPIIRFDAAMTLTQKHYQRLWFPEPGTGGDIPSRSLKGLSKKEFQKYLPREFWKEVVERISIEAPDTLLLAEAFWLMEAYFVRNLGMHRVYNSAFMNFLKSEQNAEFRNSIKNILKFDPEILKRLVNFMSNPDEETAITQFGKEDKYFCTCLLLITLPGLPLFNHGQIEGYEEKYGMEYKKPYYSERADPELVSRHQREIFPLLKKRYLFAEVNNFFLYDLYLTNGKIDEDVIVFSNRQGSESFLVAVNNKFATKSGWVKNSVPFSHKKASHHKKTDIRKDLLQGLGFTTGSKSFIMFRDHFSGLEYIRSSKKLQKNGLYIHLEAYKYQLFSGFYQVFDNEAGIYSQLEKHLDGQGTADIKTLLQKKFLNPLLEPFQNLFGCESIKVLLDMIPLAEPERSSGLDIFKNKYFLLLQTLNNLFKEIEDPAQLSGQMIQHLSSLFTLLSRSGVSDKHDFPESSEILIHLEPFLSSNRFYTSFIFIWFFMEYLYVSHLDKQGTVLEQFLDHWGLGEILADSFHNLGAKKSDTQKYLLLLKILILNRDWFSSITKKAGESRVNDFFKNPQIQRFIRINPHQNILWFHRESCEELIDWFYFTTLFTHFFEKKIQSPGRHKKIRKVTEIRKLWLESILESKFQISSLQKIMLKKIKGRFHKKGLFPDKNK